LSSSSTKAGSTIPHHDNGHSVFPGGKSSGNIGICGCRTMFLLLSKSNQSYSLRSNMEPDKSIMAPLLPDDFSLNSKFPFPDSADPTHSLESEFQTILSRSLEAALEITLGGRCWVLLPTTGLAMVISMPFRVVSGIVDFVTSPRESSAFRLTLLMSVQEMKEINQSIPLLSYKCRYQLQSRILMIYSESPVGQ
jgi:hypothetical protein